MLLPPQIKAFVHKLVNERCLHTHAQFCGQKHGDKENTERGGQEERPKVEHQRGA